MSLASHQARGMLKASIRPPSNFHWAEGAFAGAGDWVFGDEGPVELAGAFFQEVAEGFADVAFVVEIGSAEFGEGFIVGLDGGVVGF